MFMNKITNFTVQLFLQKSYQIFYNRRHSVIVTHNTSFVTVHSRVTVGGCSQRLVIGKIW